MVEKAVAAFAALHEYSEELEVLETLLAQRFWRRGKRGRWYERRALILTTHLSKVVEGEKKKTIPAVLHRARQGLIEALEDDATHLGSFLLELPPIHITNQLQ